MFMTSPPTVLITTGCWLYWNVLCHVKSTTFSIILPSLWNQFKLDGSDDAVLQPPLKLQSHRLAVGQSVGRWGSSSQRTQRTDRSPTVFGSANQASDPNLVIKLPHSQEKSSLSASPWRIVLGTYSLVEGLQKNSFERVLLRRCWLSFFVIASGSSAAGLHSWCWPSKHIHMATA